MILKIKIKPSIINGTNVKHVKAHINYKNNAYNVICSKHAVGCLSSNKNNGNNTIIAYNITKKNATRIRDKNSNKYTKTKPAHVVAYVYKFDEILLKTLNIKITQNSRNFKIENITT